jgi:hypothetical protein
MGAIVSIKSTASSWVTEVHDLIAEGESSFWKAAVIMQRQIDDGMSRSALAKELGKSEGWVRAHLKWLKEDDCVVPLRTPFSGQGPKKRKTKQQPSVDPDEMPTEEEANESWQQDVYDHACFLVDERMESDTRQRFFAYLKEKYHV